MTELGRVWLPFPPSVNNLFPTRVIKGRIMRVPSKEYRVWKKSADVLLMAARLRTFEVPVHVTLELTPRDNRARDADNYSKAILDALKRMRVLQDDNAKWVSSVKAEWKDASRLDVGVTAIFHEAKLQDLKLSKSEARALATVKAHGVLCVNPDHKITKPYRKLLDKKLIVELPGLFDAPQGFKASE